MVIGPSNIKSAIYPISDLILDSYLSHPISNLDGLIPSNIKSLSFSLFFRFDIRWQSHHLILNLVII